MDLVHQLMVSFVITKMILSAVADTSQMMHDVIIPQTFDFQG